jgi:4-diphosphocytidyl-2-C-methyl-D-erythritol kinase
LILKMEEIAYAKINLALHVRARDADGYHCIETLFAFAEDGDRLQVAAADRLTLAVRGPFAGALGAGEDNLVMRAAEALRSHYNVRAGAALILDKQLPVASGIGGGSADAAAALRLLVRWWGIDAGEGELLEIARGLGADVPACLWSETMRGEGRGDVLTPLADIGLAGTPLLLVNPGVALSTAEVFSGWDGVDRGALPAGLPLLSSRNDLEASACLLAPQIRDVLTALANVPGLILARMSGSGATCFALFKEGVDRDAAAEAIASTHPSWWRLKTRIR